MTTKLDAHYMFSIRADVSSQSIGQTPEGQRFDWQYESSSGTPVHTLLRPYVKDWWDTLQAQERMDFQTNVLVPLGLAQPQQPVLTDQAAFQALTGFRQLTAQNVGVNRQTFDDIQAKLRDGRLYPLEWFGFEGVIVSGSAWVLIRNDDVAEFSGRFTLRSKDDDEGLIDAVFTGVVDPTRRASRAAPGDSPSLPSLEREMNAAARLRLLLAATFNAAGAARPWAPSRIIAQAAGFWKYQRLTQRQFIALGEADAIPVGKDMQVTKIVLDILELRP